jgi:transcription antitermination factor NusG
MKCVGMEETNINAQQEVNKIFETIDVDVQYEYIRSIGKNWKGWNMLLVKLRDFGDKLKVMRSRRKLLGTYCYIENEMTKEERNKHASLRWRASEEKTGNSV